MYAIAAVGLYKYIFSNFNILNRRNPIETFM